MLDRWAAASITTGPGCWIPSAAALSALCLPGLPGLGAYLAAQLGLETALIPDDRVEAETGEGLDELVSTGDADLENGADMPLDKKAPPLERDDGNLEKKKKKKK